MRRDPASALLLLLSAAACATTPPPAEPAAPAAPPPVAVAAVTEGPPLSLETADAHRAALLVSVTVPTIDGAMNDAADIAHAVSPMVEGRQLRDMVLAKLGLPPPVTAALDTTQPLGLAFVSPGPHTEPAVVLAVAARSPGDAEAALAALGKTTARRGAARQIDAGGGPKVWGLIHDTVLLVGDSDHALEIAGSLALEARRGGAEDLTVVVFPDAIAHAKGTDTKAGIGQLIDDLQKMQEAVDPGAAANRATTESLRSLGDRLADSQRVEVGVDLAGATGITVATRLYPKPGTALAGDARTTAAAKLPPGLTAGEDLFLSSATTMGPYLRAQAQAFKGKLGRLPAAESAKALALFSTILDGLQGPLAIAVRTDPAMGMVMVGDLKDAKTAAAVKKALASTSEATAAAIISAQFEVAGLSRPAVRAKKEKVGAVPVLHATITPAGGNDPMTKLLGGASSDLYVGVDGTSLLLTMGAKAKEALKGWKKGTPEATCADALKETAGRDGVVFMDFGPLLRLVGRVLEDPRAQPLRGYTGHLPMHVSWMGDGKGERITVEGRIPPGFFAGVAGLLPVLGPAMMNGAL